MAEGDAAMGGMDPEMIRSILVGLTGAIVGALTAAAVRWAQSARELRVTRALDLYAEFHAPALNAIRIRAHALLDRPSGGMPAAYEAASDEDKSAIASLVHYFEKVAVLARLGAIDLRLYTRFMRQYAGWWSPLLVERDRSCLDDPEWGATLRDIDWLFQRMRRVGGFRRAPETVR